jgi:hypothetical protein
MSVHLDIFRGQGVRVGGKYGVIHSYTTPGKVLVRFKDGFETIAIDQLLPVAAIQDIGHRFAERDLELELPTPMEQRDGEIEPDVSDEDKEGSSENEFEEELAEMVEE